MIIQVFVDESAGHGSPRHFGMAGLISSSERWVDFSYEWRACLGDSPAIKYFKMKEAVGRTEQFHRFSHAERDNKLRSLARIINRHVGRSIYFMFDLEAHGSAWAKLKKPFNSPYFWPFQNIIIATTFDLWDAGLRERFEMIFDREVILGPRARNLYPTISGVVRRLYPDEFSIMPTDPMFRDDMEFLQLQAADFMIGCLRRSVDNKDGENSLDWLADELPAVTKSERSVCLPEEEMKGFIDRAEQRTFESLFREIHKEMYDDDDC